MRSRWTSITSGFLLALFLFNVCIFGIVLSARLHFHQLSEESKRHKSPKEVVELRIPAALVDSPNEEFQWMKNWEFRYRGEMYDIVESHREGNMWVFACKHDTKEDMLRKHMERQAQDNNAERNSQSKKNLKIVGEFITYASPLPLCRISFACSIPESAERMTSAHRSIPDPPPWFG
jgi:hypothetical protein